MRRSRSPSTPGGRTRLCGAITSDGTPCNIPLEHNKSGCRWHYSPPANSPLGPARFDGPQWFDPESLFGRDVVSFDQSDDVDPELTAPLGATPVQRAEAAALADAVERTLAHLRANEAEVIRHRFGLGGRSVGTQEEVGRRLGISVARVRRIEHRALARLRRDPELLIDFAGLCAADRLPFERVVAQKRAWEEMYEGFHGEW